MKNTAMMFKESQMLKNIPAPQGDDPTNCVLYCYINLFNETKPFIDYMKGEGGHSEHEEYLIVNKAKNLWQYSDITQLFHYKLADNGGSIDGLTSDQVRKGFEFFNHEEYDGENWFCPVFMNVNSRYNMLGSHRIMVLWDGLFNEGILCDPQIKRYVKLSDIYDLIWYYKTIESFSLVAYNDDEGTRALYFRKVYFNHLPF